MTDRLLLATDLDRTLLPNGPQPESPGARRHFAALAGRPEVTLCYVTGRHRELVGEAIANYELPRPDYVIGDVGTTICRVESDGAWHPLPGWDERIAEDWAGHGHAEIAALIGALAPLRRQEDAKQNRHKLSFYLPANADPAPLEAEIRRRLEAAGVTARLVWSVDEAADVGLLDVLPARASKYHALEALKRARGLGEHDAVFCGDSGNDLEVLASPLDAVLVANALPDVQNRARDMAAAAGTADRLYVARGGFRGMNGHYAAGILEGVAHYHPDTVAWMGFAENGAAPAVEPA